MSNPDGQEREVLEKEVAKIVRPFLFAQGTHAREAAAECSRKVVAALAAREDTERPNINTDGVST